MSINSEKIKFAIVGSGYRARFFIRIAKYYNEKYEITGLLCRNEEKANTFSAEYGIKTTLSEDDIIASKPDFIVVAVNKTSIATVSEHWQALGFTVLCETPAGMYLEELNRVYNNRALPGRLIVAEQYVNYPVYKRIIQAVKDGKLGEPVSATVSLAHEYHGMSLIRRLMNEPYNAKYRIRADKYDLKVTKTADRYNKYTDGELVCKRKVNANIEFADGKVVTYDFDSEQYRSSIRHNMFRVSGTRGEIINEKLWYLDADNEPKEEILVPDIHSVRGCFEGQELPQDETAIEALMEQAYKVNQGATEAIKWQEISLKCALEDAYFMLLLNEADGNWTESQKMPWH